ncbi:MAG: phosphoglucomutase/phosphomannomutase family protein [Ruminococcaceae bacterium]|nr:phosphoglucomutase/phosphomannomutase family protein [Oscillospiraceae bacterium]
MDALQTKIKFGTGGWRAIIGDDFTKENICRVAQGIVELMRSENKTDRPVIIGYDRRFMSEDAARWVAEVLCANGIKVNMVRRSVPTPLVMFIVKNDELYYGIEITASHNPSCYNGIKLIVEEGRDASLECTEKLESLIDKAPTVSTDIKKAEATGLVEYLKTPFNEFLDSILEKLDVQTIRNAGLRVLFDPMHGSGTYPLMSILYTTRCTVDLMHSNKDAYFGGSMPAPSHYELGALIQRVVHEHYDLGIAVDGDGDRLGIVDSNGAYLNANQILVMLYYYLHEYRGWKGAVVRNLATTHMLDKIASSFGEECYEVPVGFKYISSKMDEVDALIGGESSGGLTVRGHIYGKDSVYAASLFVEMVCAVGKPLSEFWQELVDKYGTYELVECNISFSQEEKDRVEKLLMRDKLLPVFPKTVARVNYEDGCKVYFEDDSFIICRFSGTEPLIRIFAEAKDAKTAASTIEIMKNFINA